VILIWTAAIGWIGVQCLAGFVLMGFDKSRALGGGWRIPEKTFFTLAVVGGAFGILLACYAFHHKTRKAFFMGTIVVATVLWLAVVYELINYFGLPLT
jgi:uncharacterized membrane protein YsdA (DUF1294 family)